MSNKTKVVDGETYYCFADDEGNDCWISESTLKQMDSAVENYKNGITGEPIDLNKLKNRRREYNHEYYARNREKLLPRHREYGRTHKQKRQGAKIGRPRKSIEEKKERVHEWEKKRYQNLKAQGICVRCKKAPAMEGRTYCEACAAKHHAYYKDYFKNQSEEQKSARKAAQLAYIEKNRDAVREYSREYRSKNRNKINAMQRKIYENGYCNVRHERYQDRKSKGICVACGKAPAIEGEVFCVACKEKRSLARKAKSE
ncbi:MAG: hypothetical protein LUD51_07040 [Clostridia bacterium]|nr:hypothetical protein [Clostridia bacterium]